MSLLNRKRLRWLRRWLYGKPPQLVTPAPIIGAHRALSDELWGSEAVYARRLGLRLPGPSDAEWVQRYNEVSGGHITYDPKTAQARLLNLLTDDRGRPLLRVVIEPTVNRKD